MLNDTQTMDQMHNSTKDQLKTIVERIERLEEEAVLATYLHALDMANPLPLFSEEREAA